MDATCSTTRRNGILLKFQCEEAVRHETEEAEAHPVNKDKSAKEFLNSMATENAQTYFNNKKSHDVSYSYDQSFHIKEGYNAKLKRDDRLHNVGLKVNEEEKSKSVPILSSSVYGQRSPLEQTSNEHFRVAHVRRDFYRSSGTKIPYATRKRFCVCRLRTCFSP